MGASALMAKGGCAVFRKTTGNGYQKWTDYPDSPCKSEEFPYQCIYNRDGVYCLAATGVDQLPCEHWYIYQTHRHVPVPYPGSPALWEWRYQNGVWNWNGTVSPFQYWQTGGYLESNYDVIDYVSRDVYFAKTTTPAQDAGMAISLVRENVLSHKNAGFNGYQKWAGYPDSPMLSQDFPYQAVVRAWHGGSDFVTVLFGCKGQLGTYSNFGTLVLYDTGYDGSDRPIAYTYTDGVWVPYRTPRPSDIIMGQISYLIWPEYYEANYDILGGIAKTTTSDQDGRVGRFRVSNDFVNSQSQDSNEVSLSGSSLKDDFSITQNPIGPWSFGSKPSKEGTFSLYAVYDFGVWYSSYSNEDRLPCIWKNYSSTSNNGVPPGEVSLHAGFNNAWSVVRWTASGSGVIRINGFFGAGDIGQPTYSIYHNSALLFDVPTSQTTRTFDLQVSVVVGDILDFQVGEWVYEGNTPISITITNSGTIRATTAFWSSIPLSRINV